MGTGTMYGHDVRAIVAVTGRTSDSCCPAYIAASLVHIEAALSAVSLAQRQRVERAATMVQRGAATNNRREDRSARFLIPNSPYIVVFSLLFLVYPFLFISVYLRQSAANYQSSL